MMQRSQYRYVIPPAGISIKGEIMPARDVSGDGSWNELRGEDACFLAEASHRARMYRTYGSQASPPDVSSGIMSSPLNNARSDISDYPCHEKNGVKYSASGAPAFAGGYVMDVGSTDIVPEVLSNVMIPYSASSTSAIYGSLSADAIRAMYYDLRKSGFWVYSGQIEGTCSGVVTRKRDTYSWDEADGWSMESSETTYPTSPFGTLLDISKRYYDVAGAGGVSTVYDWTVTHLPPSATTSSTQISNLYGAQVSCWAVFAVTTNHSNRGGVQESFNDAIVAQGDIGANGIIDIGSLTAFQVLAAVGGARSVPLTWGDLVNGESVTVSLSPSALVFYDEEIDTSAINWTWRPESE